AGTEDVVGVIQQRLVADEERRDGRDERDDEEPARDVGGPVRGIHACGSITGRGGAHGAPSVDQPPSKGTRPRRQVSSRLPPQRIASERRAPDKRAVVGLSHHRTPFGRATLRAAARASERYAPTGLTRRSRRERIAIALVSVGLGVLLEVLSGRSRSARLRDDT